MYEMRRPGLEEAVGMMRKAADELDDATLQRTLDKQSDLYERGKQYTIPAGTKFSLPIYHDDQYAGTKIALAENVEAICETVEYDWFSFRLTEPINQEGPEGTFVLRSFRIPRPMLDLWPKEKLSPLGLDKTIKQTDTPVVEKKSRIPLINSLWNFLKGSKNQV